MMRKVILTSVAVFAAQYAFAITACVDGMIPEAAGAKVSIAGDGGVRIWATNVISTVTLSWEADFAPTAKVLGDVWERTYGDTYWCGICEKRDMPWYFLLSEDGRTEGWGVETQPNALAMWRATTNRALPHENAQREEYAFVPNGKRQPSRPVFVTSSKAPRTHQLLASTAPSGIA